MLFILRRFKRLFISEKTALFRKLIHTHPLLYQLSSKVSKLHSYPQINGYPYRLPNVRFSYTASSGES